MEICPHINDIDIASNLHKMAEIIQVTISLIKGRSGNQKLATLCRLSA